jgi:hypothetical protein
MSSGRFANTCARSLPIMLLCALLTASIGLPLAQANAQSVVNPHPVTVDIYLNGSIVSGTMNFNMRPGSTSIINLKTVYPWASYSTLSRGSTIAIDFGTSPFPVASTTPSWLHVSIPSSLTMEYGQNPSTSLSATVDKTATPGTAGSFEVTAHYIDPVSGHPDTEISVVRITVSGPLPGAASQTSLAGAATTSAVSRIPSISHEQSDHQPHHSLRDPSWAIGVGLCDNSDKSQCNSSGIGWSSVNAVYTNAAYPSLTPSSDTYFTVNARISSAYYLQFTLLNPYGGTNNWQLQLWFIDCSSGCTYYHANMGSAGASGTEYMEILHDSTNGWEALDTSNTWTWSAYVTQCCGTSTTFYGAAQEPIAFESYSTTSGDFSGMEKLQSPSFKYSTNGGFAWSSPPVGILVDSNGAWGGYKIGDSNTAVPTWFLEGGHSQCSSVSSPNVDIGYTGYVCSGATNTDLTQLF